MKKLTLFLILSLGLLGNTKSQMGFLIGGGVTYDHPYFTVDLLMGIKSNKLSLGYHQIAIPDASQPAYFGAMAGYDVITGETRNEKKFHLSITTGYYYRYQSQDNPGKSGGNYFVYSGGINYNVGGISVVTRYIDKSIHVGFLFSALIRKNVNNY